MQKNIHLLKAAELQFRLASAVRLATMEKRQSIDIHLVWTHGKHSVEYHEIALTPKEADYAAWGSSSNVHTIVTYQNRYCE